MAMPRLAQQPTTHCKQSPGRAGPDCDGRRKRALGCKNRALRCAWFPGREIISIIFANNPKVPASAAVKGGQPLIRPKKNCRDAHMTSNEVLSMYENIAGLTGKMAAAAQSGDWNGFDGLQAQCAAQASTTASGVPALDGAKRQRKIDLLKQIMANDRAVRDVTEPWMGQLDRAMRAH
jgi:flagellar protein FliT